MGKVKNTSVDYSSFMPRNHFALELLWVQLKQVTLPLLGILLHLYGVATETGS
jgi:hypothetical protein